MDAIQLPPPSILSWQDTTHWMRRRVFVSIILSVEVETVRFLENAALNVRSYVKNFYIVDKTACTVFQACEAHGFISSLPEVSLCAYS
jgi:hypothetical protein